MKLVYTKKARINTVQTRGLGFKLIMHERTITVCTYYTGLAEQGGWGGGGHCVLKWGFTWTFHGSQDATLK